MPGKALRFRFPHYVEIRYGDEAPHPGEIVRGAGQEWMVRSVEHHSAYTVCNLDPWDSGPQVAGHGFDRPPFGPPASVGSDSPSADPSDAKDGALDDLARDLQVLDAPPAPKRPAAGIDATTPPAA